MFSIYLGASKSLKKVGASPFLALCFLLISCGAGNQAPERLPAYEKIEDFHSKLISQRSRPLQKLKVIIDYGSLMYPLLSNATAKNLIISYLETLKTAGVTLEIYNMEKMKLMQSAPDNIDALFDANLFRNQTSDVIAPLKEIVNHNEEDVGFLLLTDFIASRRREPNIISQGAPGAPYFAEWLKRGNTLDILALKYKEKQLQNLFFIQFLPGSLFPAALKAQTSLDWLHNESVKEAKSGGLDAHLFSWGLPYFQLKDKADGGNTNSGSLTQPIACYQYQTLKKHPAAIYSLNSEKLDAIAPNSNPKGECKRLGQTTLFQLVPAFRLEDCQPDFEFHIYNLKDSWQAFQQNADIKKKNVEPLLDKKDILDNFFTTYFCKTTKEKILNIEKPASIKLKKQKPLWVLGVLRLAAIRYEADSAFTSYLTSHKITEPDTQLLESLKKALIQWISDYSNAGSPKKNVYYAYYFIK
jgi:hypothetical protein